VLLNEVTLNIGYYNSVTEVEGPGKRFALWVQGCFFRCPDCCNPHLLEFKENRTVTVEFLLEEILKVKDTIEGVTFIGGEPFAQAKSLAVLAKELKKHDLSVMIFTGFTLNALKRLKNKNGESDLIDNADIIVDGLFKKDQASRKRRYIGSDNQVVHILSDRYKHLVNNWPIGDDGIEIKIEHDSIMINGYPHPEITRIIEKGLKFI
jgi:anaerobic ribonucleoside-triphosphate reductase activating protein